MYRDELEAALLRAQRAEEELARAEELDEQEQAVIADLKATVDAQHDEIARLRELVGEEEEETERESRDSEPSPPAKRPPMRRTGPDADALDALVARGAAKEEKRKAALAKQKADRVTRRPKLERVSTTRLGFLATPFVLVVCWFPSLVFAAVVAEPGHVAPGLGVGGWMVLITVVSGAALYGLATLVSRMTHAATVRWVETLPFRLTNYPALLGLSDIWAIDVQLGYEGEPASEEILRAAVNALGKPWLEVRGPEEVRVRGEGAGLVNSKVHHRLRWTVERLIEPIHAKYPLTSVRASAEVG